MSYWRNINPSGAIADLRTVYEQAGKHRWIYLTMAGLTTVGIFSIMAQESWRKPPAKPEITYITTWAPDRTDAEIVASNIANQKRNDALRAEQAKREEDVRNIYKKLGRMSGMDVDKIEREAEVERAAEAAARKAALDQQLARQAEAATARKP